MELWSWKDTGETSIFCFNESAIKDVWGFYFTKFASENGSTLGSKLKRINEIIPLVSYSWACKSLKRVAWAPVLLKSLSVLNLNQALSWWTVILKRRFIKEFDILFFLIILKNEL